MDYYSDEAQKISFIANNSSTSDGLTLENVDMQYLNDSGHIEQYEEVVFCSNSIKDKMEICLLDQTQNSDRIKYNNIKTEIQVNDDATEDESMAVEALRELGGLYKKTSSKEVYSCERCKKEMVDESFLLLHSSTCVNPNSLDKSIRASICSICSESFERQCDLDNHIVCHEVDRPHSCRICGTLFRKKNELINHMSCHLQDKPHKCSICGQEFQRPSSLTNHMKIHTYVAGRAMNQQNVKNRNVDDQSGEQWVEEQFINTGDNANMFDQSIAFGNSSWNISFEFNEADHVVDNIAQEVDVNTTIIEDAFHNTVAYNQDMILHDVKIENSAPMANIKYNLNKVNVSEKKSDKRPHICKQCGIGFSRMKALISHERLHQDSYDSFECENCEEEFSNETSLTKHNIACLLRKRSRVNITSKSAQKIDTQSSTMNFSLNLKGYKHDISNVNQTEKNLEKELPLTKISKQIKHHACPDCPKHFATKQKMYRHMWIHRKKTFTCEICARTFPEQNELDEHRLSQHPGDSPYLCQECGKCFASRQGLWEHGRVHNAGGNAGQFHCTECNKQFASRQGFLIHTRTHTGERPYGCRYCWKAFRDGGTLRKHERIHTGERPHSCPLCTRAFNQKVVLREHIRWVHAANKTDNLNAVFQCQLCNQVLSDREELCAHIVKHSDQIAAESKLVASKADSSRIKNIYVKSNKCVQQSKYRKRKTNMSSVQRETMQFDEYTMNFPCDLCGLLFGTRETLRNHVKVHI